MLPHPVNTPRALLHHAPSANGDVWVLGHLHLGGQRLGPVVKVEAADFVRAVVLAVARADAAIVDHLVGPVRRVNGRRDRTYRLTRRVLAVLAHDRLREHLGIVVALLLAHVIAVVANPVHVSTIAHLLLAHHLHVVFARARHDAGVAPGTGIQVNRHPPLILVVGVVLVLLLVFRVVLLPDHRVLLLLLHGSGLIGAAPTLLNGAVAAVGGLRGHVVRSVGIGARPGLQALVRHVVGRPIATVIVPAAVIVFTAVAAASPMPTAPMLAAPMSLSVAITLMPQLRHGWLLVVHELRVLLELFEGGPPHNRASLHASFLLRGGNQIPTVDLVDLGPSGYPPADRPHGRDVRPDHVHPIPGDIHAPRNRGSIVDVGLVARIPERRALGLAG